MTRDKLVELLTSDVAAFNRWRNENPQTLVDLSGAKLHAAVLRYADLSGAKLHAAVLRYADLRYAKLHAADLRYAKLHAADLRYAELHAADLRRAQGLPAAPVVSDLDAQILAEIEGGNRLDMADWHTCETTHCRGGWAIFKAGEAGVALERKLGSNVVAALAYAASRPDMRAPDFFVSDNDALADIRRCANA